MGGSGAWFALEPVVIPRCGPTSQNLRGVRSALELLEVQRLYELCGLERRDGPVQRRQTRG